MTAKVVELAEWGKAETVALTPAEAATLRRMADSLSVEWLSPERARVGPKPGCVGIVSLSPELTIYVRPRWPAGSLMELAAYALGLDVSLDLFRELASIAEGGPRDWLALFLALEVERLLAQGLRQGYREVEDEIPYVRGRIEFGRLACRIARVSLVPCRFSDFVVDTEENRILRGTLELLASGSLEEPARRWVLRALAAFRQVTPVLPSRAMFDRIHLNRLNVQYRPALELCRLVLESTGLELTPGGVTGSSFFFRLSQLFEKAVERALREAFPGHHYAQPTYAHRIAVVAGGPPWTVPIRPDNVLGPWDRPWLVVDAKYKRPTAEHLGDERFLPGDLYQAFTYAVALRVPVVLVYPEVESSVNAALELGGHRVRVETVDIARRGVEALRASAAGLRAYVDRGRASPLRRAASAGREGRAPTNSNQGEM